MIKVSPDFQETALSKDSTMFNLIEVKFPLSDDVYITNSKIPITIGSKVFTLNAGRVAFVSNPSLSASLNRNLFNISLHDKEDFFWTKLLKENKGRFEMDFSIVWRKADMTITDPLRIYRGTSGAIGSSSGRAPFIYNVQLIGSFLRQDGEKTTVTAEEDQAERDPTDTAFAFSSVLREISWGGRPS